jgi:hypothetical protein
VPTLPRKPAAAELGIKVSKLRRLTEATGIGIVRRGGRGRHNQTLYDTTAIAELIPHRRARGQRDAERAAQLHRGAMALTLPGAIDDELSLISIKYLAAIAATCADSSQLLAAIVEFMRARIRGRIEEHFLPKINGSKKSF